MKRTSRFLALSIALSLTLTGCSALLEREFSHITPHNAAPTTDGDPSILRADSYQELVNALIYLVGAGAEEGTIRLYLDGDQVESSLEAACLEVVQEDPLGAYAVEYIKYSVNSVVTYFEAKVDLTYRRTREQVSSIVQATGVTAIRNELGAVLSAFAPECVLRIGYFDEDEEFIQELAQQAYYNAPATALGMPDIQVTVYPNSGRQRIVEILLDYPLEHAELERRKAVLEDRLDGLSQPLGSLHGDALIHAIAHTIWELGSYDQSGGVTAYDLLESGQADSEGIALTLAALCQRVELPCRIARGTVEGQPYFWAVIQTDDGWRHLDLARGGGDLLLYTDQQLERLGYSWDTDLLPACSAPGEES